MDHTPVDPQFVLEHAAHVRALAGRLVFDGARADDLEQETWLAALKNAPQSMTSPRGWLARIAQRRAVHDWRAESRRAAREHEVARAESVTSSEEILEREETRAELVRAVLALDEPYRAALVAQFLEERTPSEAARRRGIPVETQRTHVKRALELLRERLKRSHGAAFGAFQLALVRDLRLEAPLATTFVAAGSGVVTGGLTMWTAKELAVAAAVVAALVLGVTRPWEGIEGPQSAATPHAPAPEVARALDIAPPVPEGARAVSPDAAGIAAVDLAASTAAPVAGVVVRARVVGEDGRPIQGARASLSAQSADDSRSLTESAADGSIRFEVPMPASRAATLSVEAGEFRTLGVRVFDPSTLTALKPGDNDAGEIVLRPAGRVVGRVAASGAYVEHARVYPRVEGVMPTELSVETDAAGRFTLAHLEPASTVVHVDRPGFVLRRIRAEISAAQTVDVGEVALEPAPSIAGTVVDSTGAPAAGVVLGSSTPGLARDGRAMSRDDGSFELFFDEPGTHDLMTSSDPRFLPWGGRGVEGARFATGERDARIVVERAAVTTFRVVAAESGEPLHEFGIAVRKSRLRERARDLEDFEEDFPRVKQNAQHEIALPAQPGVHEVLVAAPGRIPWRALVATDDASAPVQTVRLELGGALRGRILRAGAPIPNAEVSLERALVPLGPSPTKPGTIEIGRTHLWDIDSFPGRSRRCAPRADGSFSFAGLAAGTYVLTVAANGALVHTVDLVRVAPRAEVDLGDISVAQPARVRGRLDTGSASPVGWRIAATGRAPIVVEREDGRFEFGDLQSGEVVLSWSREEAFGLGQFDDRDDLDRELRITLAAGETREVVLDASTCAPSRIDLEVVVDGQPLAGASVEIALKNPDGRSTNTTSRGKTDEKGTWSGLVRPGRTMRVQIGGINRLPIAVSEAFVPSPGSRKEIALHGTTGSIALVMAESMPLPEAGYVLVRVSPTDPGGDMMGMVRWDRVVGDAPVAGGRWTGRELDLGRCASGTWGLTIDVCRSVPTGPTSSSGEPLIPRVQRTITVRAGETTTVELP